MSDLQVHEGGKARLGRTKGDKKEKESGLNKAQRKVMKMYDMCSLIEKGELGCNVATVDDGTGVRRLVAINKNKEVKYVSDDYLVNFITPYCKLFMVSNEDYIWGYADAVAAMKLFKTKQAIEEPKKFAWLDDPALCFKRLPFNYEEKNHYHHPYFDQLLDNIISDRDIFMDFIGSIFINESSNQNYLWAYGLGGDGKGSFFSIIEHLLGDTCTSLCIPSPQDNHWGEMLMGKRVGIFSDVNNLTWTTSGLFKMLTGDDSIAINPKFEKHFSIKPRMKFIFASNFRPSISSMVADKRRLVFCEFKPVIREEYDNMAEKLIGEAKEIVNHCVNGYLKRYPKYTPLVSKMNTAMVEELASHAEEDLEDILSSDFEVKEYYYTTPTQLNNVLKNKYKDISKDKFIHFIESKYGIKKQNGRPIKDGKKDIPIMMYKNLKCKNINMLQIYSKDCVVENIDL